MPLWFPPWERQSPDWPPSSPRASLTPGALKYPLEGGKRRMSACADKETRYPSAQADDWPSRPCSRDLSPRATRASLTG